MRWVVLAGVTALALVGCGSTGASKEELHDAFYRGYARGKRAGRSSAELSAGQELRESYDAGYQSGVKDGEEE